MVKARIIGSKAVIRGLAWANLRHFPLLIPPRIPSKKRKSEDFCGITEACPKGGHESWDLFGRFLLGWQASEFMDGGSGVLPNNIGLRLPEASVGLGI